MQIIWDNPFNMNRLLELTQYGKDDDYEIEKVPRLLKIMVSQGEYLHETFGAKYHNENHVQIVQNVAEIIRLLIMVQSHC